MANPENSLWIPGGTTGGPEPVSKKQPLPHVIEWGPIPAGTAERLALRCEKDLLFCVGLRSRQPRARGRAHGRPGALRV